MANAISTLWAGIVTDLITNKVALGIANAERAKTGKVTSLIPPEVAVWIEPQVATLISQNGAVTVPVDVHLFCVAKPGIKEAEAVDGAMTIAVAVVKRYTNLTIGGVVLQQPDSEQVIAVVENSSSQAIVGVLLKAEVTL